MINRRSNFLLSCLLALFCAGVAPAVHADDAETWELQPDVKVDSSGIFLSQVVVPAPSSSAVHSSTVVLPHIRLAPAPTLGQTASFSRDQVIALAQKIVPDFTITNWSGPEIVRVSRATHRLTDSEFTQLLIDTLQREQVKNLGQLELQLTHPLPPALVPDEGVTLKVTELPSAGVGPNFIVRCELWNGLEHVSDWTVAAQARVWRDVPVADAPLSRGMSLKDAPVSLQRRDVLMFRDACTNFPTDDPGIELTETVPAGTPLLNRSIRVRPAILRGRMVDGVFQEGSLTIDLKVEPLEDGLPGQTIRIRNPKTNRELYGKVKNEQTILIAL
jgi:flagella basal body P-ring formation protein FlgA